MLRRWIYLGRVRVEVDIERQLVGERRLERDRVRRAHGRLLGAARAHIPATTTTATGQAASIGRASRDVNRVWDQVRRDASWLLTRDADTTTGHRRGKDPHRAAVRLSVMDSTDH